jgi:hypothetical protein
MSCTSSASSTSKTSSNPPSTRHDVLLLLESAEAAHHCAGEEATDAARAAELQRCIDTNLQTARALLPAVTASSSMQPTTLAVVRLFVDDTLTAATRQELCAIVPPTDFLDGLLDDEARAACGILPSGGPSGIAP